MSSLLFSLGAAMATEGYRQYMADEEVKMKRCVRFAFERSGLFIKVKNGKSEMVDRAKFIEMVKMKNGWFMKYRLPVGITIDDVDKCKKIIEGATKSEMVAWTEDQILNMELYTEKIPKSIIFHDNMIKDLPELSFLLGFSRRGLEILDYNKVPNPHMFVAGTSGMGKSTAINVITIQLLQKPNVRLYMGDPKRVEFSHYRGAPNVKAVEVEPLRIKQMIVDVHEKMNKRAEFLEQEGFKKLSDYNRVKENKIPYIFIIIDEIADFAPDDYEFWDPMIEIGRKGRSNGIYLIVATQRPSADVFPPNFKSNLGLKLAFRTSTLSNSRVIIDTDAAFKLPMKAGRCIYDMGFQREIQVPEIKDNQLQAILKSLSDGHEA